MACSFGQAGLSVIGIDRDPTRASRINAGDNPIGGNEPGLTELLKEVVRRNQLRATTDYQLLRVADVVLVCVDTPLDPSHKPKLDSLLQACTSVGRVMKDGVLVVIESTVPPGTTEGLARAALETASGMKSNREFFLGHCPERVMSGRLLLNLQSVSRVCGGSRADVASVMMELYRLIVRADLDPTDNLTAELVKTCENAFRDVNIAFANEVAMICEQVGGNVWNVRELVNKSPGRNMLEPGAGVGGHCIPKDPWLLISGATNARLIPVARSINDGMPQRVIEILTDALARLGRDLSAARIAVLGYSYLPGSDDIRSSPSAALVAALRGQGAAVAIQDPYVPEYMGDIKSATDRSDAVVVAVAHPEYARIDWQGLRSHVRTPLVVDCRRALDQAAVAGAGFVYRLLGASKR